MDMGGAADAADTLGGREGSRDAGRSSNGNGSERPFHYATHATTTLEHIAASLPVRARARLTARGRRIAVVSVRLTGRGGATVHSPPAATPDALYVDYRDLAALEAGASVPDIEAAIETVLAEA